MALGVWKASILLFCLLLSYALADPKAYRERLEAFLPGDTQQLRILGWVGQLDAENFIDRQRALYQLENHPALPLDLLEDLMAGSGPDAKLKLQQLIGLQSPGRSEQLLNDLLKELAETKVKGLSDSLLELGRARAETINWERFRHAVLASARANDLAGFTRSLGDAHPVIRMAAAGVLDAHLAAAASKKLEALLEDDDERVKIFVAYLLVNRGERKAVDAVVDLLRSNSPAIRWQSSKLLSDLCGEKIPADPAKAWPAWLAAHPGFAMRLPVDLPRDRDLLADRSLAGWREFVDGRLLAQPRNWSVQGGVLQCSGGGFGYLRTNEKYRNYVLTVECTSAEDSGLGLMMSGEDPAGQREPDYLEVQTLGGAVGDLYLIGGFEAAHENGDAVRFRASRTAKPARDAKWNSYRLTVREGVVVVEVNGTVVNRVYGCTKDPGRIVLRNEGNAVKFRKLLVRPQD
jgi:hypothetical protein